MEEKNSFQISKQSLILCFLCLIAPIIGFLDGYFSTFGNWVIIVTVCFYYFNFVTSLQKVDYILTAKFVVTMNANLDIIKKNTI